MSRLLLGNDYIEYNKVEGDVGSVVFLHGFRADMEGRKPMMLENLCKEYGIGFMRFDYFGHGKSSGDFNACNISTWLQNAIDVIDNLTTGKQVIIGASLGGWLMLLLAMQIPDRIAGLLGIGSAPDFTEKLFWKHASEDVKNTLMETGVYYPENEEYPYTLNLIEDGRKHIVLDGPIDIDVPVRLLHGMKDDRVPYEFSIDVAKKLTSQDVHINIIKDSEHRMWEDDATIAIKRYMLELLGISNAVY